MDGRIKEVPLSEQEFERKKPQFEAFYRDTPAVECPYLKDKVHFNSWGLEHMKLKWNRPRPIFEQYLRLKLFSVVPEVLKRSHTVQGIWQRQECVRARRNGRKDNVLKHVTYYEFVAVIGKVRLKVLVREVKGGQKFFWSVIPFWKTNEMAEKPKPNYTDVENDGNAIDKLEAEMGDGKAARCLTAYLEQPAMASTAQKSASATT